MIRKMILMTLVGLLVATGATLGCAPKEPEVYTLEVSLHSTESDTKSVIQRAIWQELETQTDGRLKANLHYGGTLAHHTETLYALRDGLCDAAHVVTMYFEGDLPLTSCMDLPCMTDFWTEHGRAFFDVYNASPALRAEWEKYNAKPVWGGISDNVVLVSKPRINTVDDLKGKNIRATAFVAKVMNEVGAIPMAIGGAEYYDAMARGIIQACTSIPLSSVKGRNMYEVADYLMMPGLGVFTGDLLSFNTDTWNSLPKDIQDIVLGLDVYSLAAPIYEKQIQEDWDFVTSRMEYVEFSPADVQKLQSYAEPIMAEWIAQMESKGLPGADVLAMYREAIAKRNAQPLIKWQPQV